MRARLARIHSESIHRALHAQCATVHDVEIRHRRPDVSMPEQFLHRAMSYPDSIKLVANECRIVCGPTRFVMPAARAACASVAVPPA